MSERVKKRILVVDDDWGIREFLKYRLSQRGYEVATAGNEKEFEDGIVNQKPDLILLDIWLGKRTGPDIYRRILAEGFDSTVPVIFISALVEDQFPKKAGNGNKYALYGKPFDFEELIKEMGRLLSLADKETILS